MIKIVEKLIQDGTLKQLINSGFMSPKILMYRNIYNDYLVNKQVNQSKCKDCVMLSVTMTADKFKVSEKTVIRARDIMQK